MMAVYLLVELSEVNWNCWCWFVYDSQWFSRVFQTSEQLSEQWDVDREWPL